MTLQDLAPTILDEAMALHPLPARPNLEWSGRLRTTAGLAVFPTQTIRLSRVVLDDAEKLRATLLHEYAHLLAVHREGPRGVGHGPAWRRAMLDLGESPRRCHDYPVERRPRPRPYGYRCQRCGAEMSRARPLDPRRRYVHTGCGGGLRSVARGTLEG